MISSDHLTSAASCEEEEVRGTSRWWGGTSRWGGGGHKHS